MMTSQKALSRNGILGLQIFQSRIPGLRIQSRNCNHYSQLVHFCLCLPVRMYY